MSSDIAEMNEIAMRIMHAIGLAREAETDNEAIGALAGMQSILARMEAFA